MKIKVAKNANKRKEKNRKASQDYFYKDYSNISS